MPENDASKFMEKKISGKTLYEGKFLRYQLDEVLLPNGKEALRDVVRHPGAVTILPLLPDGRILFVRQYRYCVDSMLYELPAGKIDPGEDLIACAKRELKEETGYRAAKWQKLGSVFTVPGFCDEIIHLYLADGLSAGEQQPDEDEFIEFVAIEIEQVEKLVRLGDICDAKTLAALYLYRLSK